MSKTAVLAEPDQYFRKISTDQVKEIVGQIGMNIWAISGGRVIRRPTGITLPCGSGYAVTVDLDASDTYVVRRIFTRNGEVFRHGQRTNVYCDEVSEVAYYASCYRSYGDDEWTKKA